jgi:hypothetical protein
LTGCDAALTGEASNLPAEDVSLPGDGLTLSGDSALPVWMRFRRQNIFPVFFVPFYKALFFAPYFTLLHGEADGISANCENASSATFHS